MNGEFGFIDIILFGMIAVFLILRLRSVLGRRDGTDGNHTDPFSRRDGTGHTPPRPPKAANQDDADSADNVVHLPGAPDDAHRGSDDIRDVFGADDGATDGASDTPVSRGLRDIMNRDPNFDPDGFMGGAQAAFDMILGAFAAGDKEALQPLLSSDVFADFAGAIDERTRAEETADNTLVGIKEIEVIDAALDGSTASVTLRFVSEQVLLTRDKDGEVVDGDANYISTVTDEWTFARDTRANDPNWAVVATGTPD